LRRFFSRLLIFSGALSILCMGAIWLRASLKAEQPTDQHFLVSAMDIAPPLPPAAALPPGASPPVQEQPTPLAEPDSGPVSGRVIRLIIPRIAVDHSVVPVDLIKGASGMSQWNTDALFATSTRRDLVGQLSISVNPGEGGNVILVGHNYDWGRYNWDGVFLHLDEIQPGNQATVYTQNGGKFTYVVQSVEKIPSDQPGLNDRYLWPTQSEQLTLVTCGGPTFGHWNAHVYVVATPIN
jgi:hypothetical protein